MRSRYFHGWTVVGGTFVMALWSFGLGFYGLAAYVAALQRLHGWAASTVSAPVTVYYVAGALVTAASGDLYERVGPRAVLLVGTVALAAGLVTLGLVDEAWQLYPTFLVMSIGWGAMSARRSTSSSLPGGTGAAGSPSAWPSMERHWAGSSSRRA
jgi:MFS family permease